MTDLSYKCEDFNVAGYTDDIIPGDTEIPRLALELQASATKLSRWLKKSYLKANPGKFHILFSTMKLEIVSSDWIPLAESFHEKFLGVTLN